MSGGIAYIFDPNNEFPLKCNKSSVDLLAVENKDDIIWMKTVLEEFKEVTGSEVAGRILNNFEMMKKHFVKVFPHEYQRALAELELEKQQAQKESSVGVENGEAPVSNESAEPKDDGKEIKNGEEKKDGKCKDVADIEDSITNVEMKKRKMDVLQNYDKVRGFVKYERENKPYRAAKSRQNDWEEIFDFKHVRKGKYLFHIYIALTFHINLYKNSRKYSLTYINIINSKV